MGYINISLATHIHSLYECLKYKLSVGTQVKELRNC